MSRAQLGALGLNRGAVEHRVAAGRLHRIHRGVYAVGHRRLGPRGRLMAAVLAGGRGAVASHRSAAALHGLLGSNGARHEITVPRHRRPQGIDVHRCRLEPGDVTTVDGVPCTTVARTLLDLADVVRPRLVERAVREADVLRVLDVGEIDDVIARANGRRGVGVVRAALADHVAGPMPTRSELEERMLALIRDAGLPRPLVNTHVEGFEVDLHWPGQGLVAEVDGAAVHHTRAAFESDRRRDAALHVAGHRVVRFTFRQISREPHHVVRTLTALLAH